MDNVNSMKRMVSLDFVESADLAVLADMLGQAEEQGAKSVILLSCSSNAINQDSLDDVVASCKIPLFGGVFPGLIYQGELKQKGAIVISINMALKSTTFLNISESGPNLINEIQQQYYHLSKHKNFLMFADSMSDNCEAFIDLFYEVFGNGVSVIGGGAGSLMMSNSPTLFTNHGMVKDAIQVIGLPAVLETSFGHGWEVADGPFLVTQSNKNHLVSLNYQPAYQVYAEAIEKVTGTTVNSANFINVAKRFPLGIKNISGELLIRDPVSTNNNELFCVGDVPTNFMVYVLQSTEAKLIEAAASAASIAKHNRDKLDGNKLDIALVFDCISRFLYLGEDFHKELLLIEENLGKNQTMVGVMSLGEITNLDNGNMAFLNKSTVIGSM